VSALGVARNGNRIYASEVQLRSRNRERAHKKGSDVLASSGSGEEGKGRRGRSW
jgi:hypothetical protein